MKVSICIFAAFCAVVLAVSFAGALHPLGDSLAVFRLHLCGSLALSALGLVWINWRAGAAAILASVLAALPVFDLWTSLWNISWDMELTAYQKNLSYRMQDTGPLVADIRASGAEIVALQEVSERLLPMLDDLQPEFPHRAVCPFYNVIGGVALVSRHRMIETRCSPGSGMVAARIAPDWRDPFWAVSVHLHWPYPKGQAEQVEKLLPMLEALDGPVVALGDFNMVAWSSTLRKIRRATGTKRVSGPFSTLAHFEPLFPLPIDMALAPGSGAARARPQFGSDHLGLLATVGIGR